MPIEAVFNNYVVHCCAMNDPLVCCGGLKSHSRATGEFEPLMCLFNWPKTDAVP